VTVPYTTVVAGTTVTASWANTNVRDQVITPFTDAASRTAAITSPLEGMVSYLRDVNRFYFYNGAAWQPVVGAAARVTRSSDQSIPTSTITPIEWQNSTYDSFGMFTGSFPTRLTALWTGIYASSASVSWGSSTSGDYRRIGIYKNGTVEDQQSVQLNNTTDANPLRQNVAVNGVLLVATDFLEVRVTHDAGAARTLEASVSNFKLVYLGPTV
jgi:hypothetical protein